MPERPQNFPASLYRGDSDPPPGSRVPRSMRLEQAWAARAIIANLGHFGRPGLAPCRPLAPHLASHIASTGRSSNFVSFTTVEARARHYMLGEQRREATPQADNWNGYILKVPTTDWGVTPGEPGTYQCDIRSQLGVVQQVVVIDAAAFLVANPGLGGVQRDDLLVAAREDSEWIVWLAEAPPEAGIRGPNAVLELSDLASAETFRLDTPRG